MQKNLSAKILHKMKMVQKPNFFLVDFLAQEFLHQPPTL